MNKSVISFVIGAAIGSLMTWTIVKRKYEQIAQEEINAAVAERHERKTDRTVEESPRTARVTEKPDINEYLRRINESGYNNGGEAKMDKPYVITPKEFGTLDDYEIISLKYYSDGILTDDDDELVEDIDEIVGVESLEHFGEYEEDSVFVRNDARRCDYEILLDLKKYSDVVKEKPYLTEA